MGQVTIRPATADDFLEIDGKVPPVRAWALAGDVDGRCIGVGGIGSYPDGERVAFLRLRPEARNYPVALYKVALRTIVKARADGYPRLLALSDGGVEAAERFLLRLGFIKCMVGEKAVYVLELGS